MDHIKIDFNTLSFVLAIISICISVFALWQSNEHKKGAQTSERIAVDALSEIKSEMKTPKEYAIPELKNYGDAVREFMYRDRVQRVEQIATASHSIFQSPSLVIPNNPKQSLSAKKSLRNDILKTIIELKEKKGKAQSMSVTNALKEEYEFGLVYGELIMLRDEGIIRWQGNQDSLQPHAGIEIINPE